METSTLHDLLLRLHDRGVTLALGAAGDTIRLAPAAAVDDDLRHDVRASKPALLDLLHRQTWDRARRVDVMRGSTYMLLHDALPYVAGRCFSCWTALPPGHRWGRCPDCAAAMRLVLTTPTTNTVTTDPEVTTHA